MDFLLCVKIVKVDSLFVLFFFLQIKQPLNLFNCLTKIRTAGGRQHQELNFAFGNWVYQKYTSTVISSFQTILANSWQTFAYIKYDIT